MPLPRICEKCGVHNPATAIYCECGHELEKASGQDTPSLVSLNQPVPLPSASSSSAQTVLPRILNYFITHWRGDHSLARSYWINTQLPSLLFAALLEGLPSTEVDLVTSSPILTSLGAIALWVIMFAVTVWQLVGLFRSAKRHLVTSQHRETRFWAHVVQVLVVLGIIIDGNVLVQTAIPNILEFGKIAMGDETYSKHIVRVLRNGTELEILGGISFGLSDEVRRNLIDNPQIRVVHLNSLGGRIGEARKLRDLIMDKHLATYSSRGCMSACMIAYMAGTERYLYKNAKLGFHRYAFPGFTNEDINREMQQDKTNWRNAGVARSFIEKAFSTPNKELWKPTSEELLRAGVVTQVTDGKDFAMSQTGLEEGGTAFTESALTQVSVFAAIKKYDPKTYEQILYEFGNAKKGDTSERELIANIRGYTVKLFARYAPNATDESIMKLGANLVDSLKFLEDGSPELCYAFLFPDQARRVNPAESLPAELKESLLQSMSSVIESAVQTPQSPPSKEQVDKIMEGIGARLTARYPNDVSILSQLDNPGVDKREACILATAMIEEMLKLPKKHSSAALRSMYMQE